MPLIDRNSPTPFYQQVYEQIARGIDEKYYVVGEKLPSIRECARELGVSSTTIELAYQRLTEEGYVEARRGSGFTICELPAKPSAETNRFAEEYRLALEELAHTSKPRSSDAATIIWDFSYDAADPTLFPFATWARISRDVFFNQGAEAACLYNDRQGLYDLRVEISRHIAKEHGIPASADQILVMPTTRDLVSDIMALFDPSTTVISMEEPGYDEVATKLEQSGFGTCLLPVLNLKSTSDIEQAIEGANIVFLTPACQFPTNKPMPVELRKQLVDWARRTNAYLIDDEYGWEYQMGTDRVPSLAALDNDGRVIALGTFSSAFTPAVCLSFAVLPPQLMLKWRKVKGQAHPKVAWQTQAAMAEFMREGHWRTHIRRVRTLMTKKRNATMNALQRHLGESVHTIEGACSTFVLVQTIDGRTESELVESAERAGVRVYPTSRYWSKQVPDDWRYVLVGYAGMRIDDIEPGIRALAEAWKA